MTSASKRKGSAAERAVVDWLRANGFRYAERGLAGSSKDTGDIVGVIPGLCLEVKNQSRMTLAAWVDELKVEMANLGAWSGALIHKRKGTTDVGEWYVTMPASVWLDLIKEAEA